MIIKNERHAVYMLMDKGETVYVGKTENIITRIYQHQVDKSKAFDSAKIIYVDCGLLSLYEFAYIYKYRPKLNKDIPTIKHSVRETAARSYNKCVADECINEMGFDLNNPDFTATLGGKTHGLWAKKGEASEFSAQIEAVLDVCAGLEDKS